MQLPLPVQLPDDETFASLYVQDNTIFAPYIQQKIDHVGQSEAAHSNDAHAPICFIHAPEGAGKSHVLYASCHYAQQASLQTMYIDMKTLINMPLEVLQGFDAYDVLCIDNVDALAGNKQWEIALFDLINKVLEKPKASFLLLAAKAGPKSLDIQLPDLVSRLTWGGVFGLPVLDDEERAALLVQRFASRGMNVSDDTVKFILSRAQRTLPALMQLVAKLDRASLQAKRKITIPFVKEILAL